MKTNLRLKFATALLSLSTFTTFYVAQPSTSLAQGTAFTYQGRLNDGAYPADGIYDLRFAVYDLAAGGSLVAGPLTNSAVSVNHGLFTVTLDFGAGAFTGADRWLEIAVRINGAGLFVTLDPRQLLTATPYAVTAGSISGPINGSAIVAGTVTGVQLAAGAVTGASIASNSITSGQLASGAAAANLNASGQSGVASGGMILSSNDSDANLAGAGYVKLGKVDLGNVWEPRASQSPLAARYNHTALWTGSELIIWGGTGAGGLLLNDGGKYNPALNSWTMIATNGAPSPRQGFAAIWTGSEMIVWGGLSNLASSFFFNDGARYDPVANTWTAVSTAGVPGGRYNHTAVWTGSEMIVWGGQDNGGYLFDGSRYNPVSNAWSSIPLVAKTPSARMQHTAVWTGSEMIIWGGYNGSAYLNAGGRYNPASNSWLPVPTVGGPLGRRLHSAVWTGSEMIMWGGENGSTLGSGGRYLPGGNWSSFREAEHG